MTTNPNLNHVLGSLKMDFLDNIQRKSEFFNRFLLKVLNDERESSVVELFEEDVFADVLKF